MGYCEDCKWWEFRCAAGSKCVKLGIPTLSGFGCTLFVQKGPFKCEMVHFCRRADFVVIHQDFPGTYLGHFEYAPQAESHARTLNEMWHTDKHKK